MTSSLQRAVLAMFLFLPPVAGAQSLEKLLRAVESGDAKEVSAELDRGLDVNSVGPEGVTILMMAARLGHEPVVGLLLERRAALERRTARGDTALMMASLGGHLEIAKRLIAAGAQVNRPGWTPLHYAAFGGNPELVRFLLERGAEKNAVAPNGYTALMLAVIEGKSAAARAILYEDPDLAHRGPAGESALGLAQKRGDPEMVELLRRAGALD